MRESVPLSREQRTQEMLKELERGGELYVGLDRKAPNGDNRVMKLGRARLTQVGIEENQATRDSTVSLIFTIQVIPENEWPQVMQVGQQQQVRISTEEELKELPGKRRIRRPKKEEETKTD